MCEAECRGLVEPRGWLHHRGYVSHGLVRLLASASICFDMELLKEFRRHTAVEVCYSGQSIVFTDNGLPEGGMLGPLLYGLLPALLDKTLQAVGAGIGVTIDEQRVRGASIDALDACFAPLLSGLDCQASLRIPILLIADD